MAVITTNTYVDIESAQLTWDGLSAHQWSDFRMALFEGQATLSASPVVTVFAGATISGGATVDATAIRAEFAGATATGTSRTEASVYVYRRDIKADMQDYLPRYYSDSVVANEIIDREATELLVLNAEIEEVLDQFFVDTATYALDRWEKLYGIPTDKTKTVGQRRAYLKARMRSYDVGTLESIKTAARPYFEIEITENLANYEIIIKTVGVRGEAPYVDDFIAFMRELIPAHLAMRFEFTYLPWMELDTVTFNTVETYTWDGLAEAMFA